MTVGQRIAQKRKKLGLSQEALGEQLGVSRQSIYKWESDTVLPEVEKLIALSRMFSVSVGWLLGIEEAPEQPGVDGQLTETQLAMVREIVEQYLAALPKLEPEQKPPQETTPAKPRRRWPRVLAWCGAFALVAALFSLFNRLDQVTQNYQALQMSLQNVQSNVNSQIGSITDRMEDILQSQNELTADYHTAYLSSDLAANTATFSVYALPKTYQPGMTAVFQARSGGELTQLVVEQPDGDNAFAGEITCPLTDDITLSVVFVTGEVEQTQWLEDWDYLYSDSFPMFSFHFPGLFFDEEDGVLPAEVPQDGSGVDAFDQTDGSELSTRNMDLRVGLFRDKKLLMWYGEETVERIINGVPTQVRTWFRPQEIALEPGHEYVEAILYTDEYGRQRVYPDTPLTYDEQSGQWGSASSGVIQQDPSDWEF